MGEWGTIKKGIPAGASGVQNLDEKDGLPGWKFVIGYLLMAVASVVLFGLQKANMIDPPVEEECEVEVAPVVEAIVQKEIEQQEVEQKGEGMDL